MTPFRPPAAAESGGAGVAHRPPVASRPPRPVRRPARPRPPAPGCGPGDRPVRPTGPVRRAGPQAGPRRRPVRRAGRRSPPAGRRTLPLARQGRLEHTEGGFGRAARPGGATQDRCGPRRPIRPGRSRRRGLGCGLRTQPRDLGPHLRDVEPCSRTRLGPGRQGRALHGSALQGGGLHGGGLRDSCRHGIGPHDRNPSSSRTSPCSMAKTRSPSRRARSKPLSAERLLKRALPAGRLAHERHRPVGEGAALRRAALQDRDVVVPQVALDPLEGRLDPPTRTFEHLREGARVEHQGAGYPEGRVVALGRVQDLADRGHHLRLRALQQVLAGIDETVEVAHGKAFRRESDQVCGKPAKTWRRSSAGTGLLMR